MALKTRVSFSLNVREFDTMGHTNEQVKTVFCNSIIVKLKNEATLPCNFGIHKTRGSSAIEKIKSSGKYYENP